MLRVSEDGNRRREGYLANYRQLRNSLIDLQNAADRIFDTISERTAYESEKLMDISNRIQNAKARIDAIAHSRQAIEIRSSSRYPSNSKGEEDFQSFFGYKDAATGVGFSVSELLVNGGLNREFGVDGTLELFQFFSETTSDFLPKEVQPKVDSKVTHSNGTAFIENLLEPPNFTYSSLLKEDNIVADSSLNPKHQALPPPPPSLLHSSRELPRSGSFSSRPSVLQASKLQNTLPDLPNISNMVWSGSQRDALLASIRDPGIVLRETGFVHSSSSPTILSTSLDKGSDSGGHENILAAQKPKEGSDNLGEGDD